MTSSDEDWKQVAIQKMSEHIYEHMDLREDHERRYDVAWGIRVTREEVLAAKVELDATREVTDAEIDAAAIVLFAEWQQFGENRAWEQLDHFERGSFRSTAAKMFEAAREVKA
jgi:hypothetical protein